MAKSKFQGTKTQDALVRGRPVYWGGSEDALQISLLKLLTVTNK